ncbi:MerR family transcriptional regulator [Levilactobacillus brevis]|nr:MerR family transcriptional regulator [Levilactobacillus brevis]
MLTIQKFATLAGTTRRTLIFYDQQDLFKPKTVAANGYRYYDYDQLYAVSFILELRRLGLSIAAIKALNAADSHASLNTDLKRLLTRIDKQVDDLMLLRATLNTRFNQPEASTPVTKNRPFISVDHQPTRFCRSRQSVGCTEAEIAAIYADFYDQLGKLQLVNQQDSGFLTQLPESSASRYPTASFCILKEITEQTATADLPRLEKPAGNYITIDATNDTKSICIALKILADYIDQHQLSINDQLWQMNLGERFTSKGSSPLVRLQYQLH